jgi:hypothetical protein
VNAEFRMVVMKAVNAMISTYEKRMTEFDFIPLLRIEVRELRSGDSSLGESIIVDQIKEHQTQPSEDEV